MTPSGGLGYGIIQGMRKYLMRGVLLPTVLIVAVVAVNGCASSRRDRDEKTEVTGYCNCGKCCGWERSLFGLGGPVYSYGPNKGKPKKVGVTASGTKAHYGTVAADPKLFKFGTVLDIPGYGRGVVEDIGRSIKGRHIDVWFPTHEAALKWGRKNLKVKVVKRKK